MCIFCNLHRLSQLLPAMLPWLVLPLLCLWGVSQALPDPWRFEITPPRLACCVFLLFILVWYEILMPRLLIWHARRSARLQEQQRTLAIELQKLRKTAVRLCRNCSTPYRDQNPSAGKFMCCYCGHVSRRPVFDLPGPPEKQGFFPHLVGSNGWIGRGPDWRSSGNGKWPESAPRYWFSVKDEVCMTEKSYSRASAFTYKLLSCFFIVVRWLCIKVFKVGSSSEDGSSDGSCKGGSKREGEKSFPESKCDKARRKAEEKRLARLEKQMLEEEERKQREEVARLMEEQRKLRDKSEAEKEYFSSSTPDRGGHGKKESEKKKQDRKREKDRVSNKSTSDGEDIDKKVTRETDRKRESSRKSDRERSDYKKSTVEDSRIQPSETGQGAKGMVNKHRYFDRMKGSILSSSRGLAGANFFGKASQTPVSKLKNPTSWSTDQVNDVNRGRAPSSPITRKHTVSSNDTAIVSNATQPGLLENTQTSTCKKSWLHLFTRAPAVSPSTNTNLESESCQNQNSLMSQMTDQYSPHKQLQFESSYPFPVYPMGVTSTNSSLISMVSPLRTEPLYSFIGAGESLDNCSSEMELFEDPCYIPDPVDLLGPVSESLDNFPVDVGSEFLANGKLDDFRPLNNVVNIDLTKLSPVEPPIPRVRPEEKCSAPGARIDIRRTRDSKSPDGSNSADDHGAWKMWDTPLCQNNLGIVGGSSSWLSSIRDNKLTQEDVKTDLPHNQISQCSMKENYFFPGSPSALIDKGNNVDKYEHTVADTGFTGDAPWLKKTVPVDIFCEDESQFPPLVCQANMSQSDDIVSSDSYGVGRSLELSSSDIRPKDNWNTVDEQNGDTTLQKPYAGGLFPGDTHMESVW